MAITTQQGVLNGFTAPAEFFRSVPANGASRPITGWSASNYNSTLNGGTYTGTTPPQAGQFARADPPGGQNSYMGRFSAMGSIQGGAILLCDRIWDNGGITINSTGTQNITSPTWPARDTGGATSGAGVLLSLDVSVATSVNAPTISVVYTNSSGTG